MSAATEVGKKHTTPVVKYKAASNPKAEGLDPKHVYIKVPNPLALALVDLQTVLIDFRRSYYVFVSTSPTEEMETRTSNTAMQGSRYSLGKPYTIKIHGIGYIATRTFYVA